MPHHVPHFVPRFEMKETDDAFVFVADVPGVKRRDLDVSVTGGHLIVSGTRRHEASDTPETLYAWERNFGDFERRFPLPEGVAVERVRAELVDGVLTVTAPKTQTARRSSRVPGRKD